MLTCSRLVTQFDTNINIHANESALFIKKTFLTAIIIIIFTWCTSPAMQPEQRITEQMIADENAARQQLNNELEQEMPALNQALVDVQERLNQLRNEQTSQNTLENIFVTTPSLRLINSDNLQLSIRAGLCGKDLINFAAFVVRYGIDWYTVKQFKNYSSKIVTENVLAQHEQLLNLLENCLSQHAPLENVSKQYSHFFIQFIKTECLIDININEICTSQLLSVIIFYLLGNELITRIKNAALPRKQPIIEEIANRFFSKQSTGHNNPAVTMNGNQMTITILPSDVINMSEPVGIAHNLETIARFFECRHQFFDSLIFQCGKRIAVLSYVFQRLNNKYQELLCKKIWEHKEKLHHLLILYTTAKSQKNSIALQKINDDLAALINECHAESTLEWIYFKNATLFKINTFIEGLIALPLFYKAGKYIYNFFNKTH
jgi:hypothetical protein